MPGLGESLVAGVFPETTESALVLLGVLGVGGVMAGVDAELVVVVRGDGGAVAGAGGLVVLLEGVGSVDGAVRVGGAIVGEGDGDPADVDVWVGGRSDVAVVLVLDSVFAGEDEGDWIGEFSEFQFSGEVIEILGGPAAIFDDAMLGPRAVPTGDEFVLRVSKERVHVGEGVVGFLVVGTAEARGAEIPVEGVIPGAHMRGEAVKETVEEMEGGFDGGGGPGGGRPVGFAVVGADGANVDAQAGDGVWELGPQRVAEERVFAELKEEVERRGRRGAVRGRGRGLRWRGSVHGERMLPNERTYAAERGNRKGGAMRIIAGRFRSRKLVTPKDDGTTRPIPDRVKESLFSMLRGNCEGAVVFDGFAGTGAIGLEALSRGARSVVFMERDKWAFEMLSKNIAALGVEEETEAVKGDVLGPTGLNRCPRPVDLVFFDPPFPMILEPLGWERAKKQMERIVQFLSDDGYLILRTPLPFRHVEVLDLDGKPVSANERLKFDEFGRPRTGIPFGKKKFVPREEPEREWSGGDLDAEAIQAESDDETRAQEREERELGMKYKLDRHEVDLKLEGAIGPETHEYASQAVHLYMRARGGAVGGA